MLQKFNPKNENIQVHVGGKLVPRAEAKVSVFDSAVQGGDAVWEGLRVYKGGIFCLDRHLERLQDSAHTLAFAQIPSKDEIKRAIFDTLKANGMRYSFFSRAPVAIRSDSTSREGSIQQS